MKSVHKSSWIGYFWAICLTAAVIVKVTDYSRKSLSSAYKKTPPSSHSKTRLDTRKTNNYAPTKRQPVTENAVNNTEAGPVAQRSGSLDGLRSQTVRTDLDGESKESRSSKENCATVGLFGNELFPSLVLTWSNLTLPSNALKSFGELPHAGMVIKNPEAGATYRVTIKGDKFIKESSAVGTAVSATKELIIAPKTFFDFYELARQRQTTPFNVTYKLAKEGVVIFEKVVVWRCHQINDCPTSLESSDLGIGFNPPPEIWCYTIAGYVNENHPWIDSLLAEALASGDCKRFSGYQGDTNEIFQQLNAIWRALQNRGVRYSDISETNGTSKGNRHQHVRFFEDTLANAQANCLDGSVALASIYRKIGLKPVIILAPGHAYVGVLFQNGKSILPIETTMLGTHSVQRAAEVALETGKWSWQKISQMTSEEMSKNNIVIIDIDRCRNAGVQPIPYLGKDGLVSSSLPKNHRTIISSQFEDVAAEAIRTGTSVTAVEMARYRRAVEERSYEQLGPVLQEAAARIKRRAEMPFDPINQNKQLQRKQVASKNLETLESAYSYVRFQTRNPGANVQAEIERAYQEVRLHQEAFNSIRPPPNLVSTGNTITDAQIRDVYQDCREKLLRIHLKNSGPYGASDLALAIDVCKQLKELADLPLAF